MSFSKLSPGCPCDCSPCEETICAVAWFRHDLTAERVPIAGAEVTVERLYTDPVTHLDVAEAYTTCTTGADGTCCVPTPDPLPAPADAPTVDPDGGGASGGVLGVGTYTAAISYVTHYGATTLGPASAAFQIGIPDATVFPTLAAPVVASTAPAAGGALQVNTYVARHVFKDAAGRHNRPSTTSAPFTVATLGDVPTLTLPALSLRDNATAIDLYLAVYDPDDEEGGTFRLYRADLTGTSVDLDAAFNPAAALAPSSNTSAKNIPRVTYTPGGGTEDHVWAIRHGETLGSRQSASASPVDLAGPFTGGTPPTVNTTGAGRFRVTCDPPLCSPQVKTVTVATACVDVGFDFLGKSLAFDLAFDCCGPASPQVELFDGETSLGTCVPVRLGDGEPCLFDVSDLAEGTVLDWEFTDADYPTQAGTIAVPECGDPQAVYAGTLRVGDVTIATRLADAYPTLTLTSPTGASVTLAGQADGSFTGSEALPGGVVAYTFNVRTPGPCNLDPGLGDACSLRISWRCSACSDATDGPYSGDCSWLVRTEGSTGTNFLNFVTRTVSCSPPLFTWTKTSGAYGFERFLYGFATPTEYTITVSA